MPGRMVFICRGPGVETFVTEDESGRELVLPAGPGLGHSTREVAHISLGRVEGDNGSQLLGDALCHFHIRHARERAGDRPAFVIVLDVCRSGA